MVDQLLGVENVVLHHAGHLYGDLKEQVLALLIGVFVPVVFTPVPEGEVDEYGFFSQSVGQLKLFLLREAGIEEQRIAGDIPRTVEGRGGGTGQKLAPGGLRPVAVVQPQGHRAAVGGQVVGKIAQPAVSPAIGAVRAAGGEQDGLFHGGPDDLTVTLVVEVGEHTCHQTPQGQEEGSSAEEEGTQRLSVHRALLSVMSGGEQEK